MTSWKYTITVAFSLVGLTAFFGNWALNQFRIAFDSFDDYNQQAASGLISYKHTNTSTSSTSTIEDFVIISPQKGSVVNIGCNYDITWQSSTTVKSIGIALIDAGTLKPAGPIASGLSATSSETPLASLNWKVGNVWPGEYYISISKINGQDTNKKSGTFTINESPGKENITKTSVCAW